MRERSRRTPIRAQLIRSVQSGSPPAEWSPPMNEMVFVTSSDDKAEDVLPALKLLGPRVRVGSTSMERPRRGAPILPVDARADLVAARAICRSFRRDANAHAILAVVTEQGLSDVDSGWQVDDVLVTTAPAAEIDLRLRLAQGHVPPPSTTPPIDDVTVGRIRVDAETRSVIVDGSRVGLVYREFQLLLFLSQHRDEIFRRNELLAAVWGRGYLGSPRSVDVISDGYGSPWARHMPATSKRSTAWATASSRGRNWRYQPDRTANRAWLAEPAALRCPLCHPEVIRCSYVAVPSLKGPTQSGCLASVHAAGLSCRDYVPPRLACGVPDGHPAASTPHANAQAVAHPQLTRRLRGE